MATLNEDVTPKLLEFQKEIVPNGKTIAALFNPANPTNPRYVEKLQATAGAIGIDVLPFEWKSPDTLDAAFTAIISRRADALHIVADSGIWDQSDRIGAVAVSLGIPSFTTLPNYAKLGACWTMAHSHSLERVTS